MYHFDVFLAHVCCRSSAPDTANGITIHHQVATSFCREPQRLYDVLLSSKDFSACTKKSFSDFPAMSAVIDPVVGGTFSVFATISSEGS